MKRIIAALLALSLTGCISIHNQNSGRDATRSTPVTATTEVAKPAE